MNVPFLLEVFLKATLLLAFTLLALRAGRSLSAALRHHLAMVGLAAVLLLPALTMLVPGIPVPALSGLLPARESKPTGPPAITGRTGLDRPADTEIKAGSAGTKAPSARSHDPKVDEPYAASRRSPVTSDPVSSPAATTPVRSSDPRVSRAGAVAPDPERSLPWGNILLFVWASGALVVLSASIAGALRVRQLVTRAIPVRDPEWLAAADEIARTLGLRSRSVQIRHTEELAVPLAAGVLRPVVLLPEEARGWDAERRRIVLLHELAHVRRRDCLALLGASLATAIYWFHPLVWMISRGIREEGERATDDLVLGSGVKASSYAAELLSVVRSLRFLDDEALPAMALAEGSDGSPLSRRLHAVLDPSRRRGAPSPTAVRLGLAALVAITATFAAVEPGKAATSGKADEPAKAPRIVAARPVLAAALPQSPAAVKASRAVAPVVAAAVPAPVATCDSTRTANIPGEPPKAVVLAMAAPPVPAPVIVASPEAIPAVVFASRRSPRSGSDWYGRGMDLHHDERYDEAIAAFQKAIEAGYKEDASAYNIACGYALKGDADRAFEWLGKAIDAGFDVASYLRNDDDLDSLKSDPRFAQLKKDSRKEVHHERNVARTTTKLERLLSGRDNGGKLYDLGSELLKLDEHDKAATAFKTAAERGYRPGASLYNTACAYSLAGRKAEALDSLHKSLEAGYDDPDHMDRDDDLDAIRNEPRYKELRDMADDLELQTGNDFGGWWSDGRPRAKQLREWRSSIQRYRTHIAGHPGCGRAHFNLGYVHLKLEQAAEARDDFQKALDAGYRKPTTMYNLACANAQLGQKDAAFDWLGRAVDAGFESKSLAKNDPDLDSLRWDSRFRQLLRRMDDGNDKDGKDD